MERLINWFTSRNNRVYLYLLGVAVVLFLVGYGVIAEDKLSLWEGLLLALLGLANAQAARHVDRVE